MANGLRKMAAGWYSWRWLSGISQKERAWFLGALKGRGGYEAWTAHLTQGLQDPEFLLKFETETDPWARSKLVGERISALRKSFTEMSAEQKLELAKQAETELRAGLELIGRDKKTIQELIEIVDPPAAK